MKKWWLLFISIFLVLFFSNDVFADITINGYVKDSQGSGIANVKVEAINAKSDGGCPIGPPAKNSFTTAANGYYSFTFPSISGFCDYVLVTASKSGCTFSPTEYRSKFTGNNINKNFIGSCSSCTPNWQCSSWSSCTNNQQTRTCTDSNNCGTITNKPPITQACCTPPPTNIMCAEGCYSTTGYNAQGCEILTCKCSQNGLNEPQLIACESADTNNNCDSLQDIGIVTKEQCCSNLNLCCSNVVSISEFKVVLINSLKDYFTNPNNAKLNVNEIKDLIIVYFSNSGNTIDLSGIGTYSNEKLIDIYNKANGNTTCTPNCLNKQCGASNGCGGTCDTPCQFSECVSNSECTKCGNSCIKSGKSCDCGINRAWKFPTCGPLVSFNCQCISNVCSVVSTSSTTTVLTFKSTEQQGSGITIKFLGNEGFAYTQSGTTPFLVAFDKEKIYQQITAKLIGPDRLSGSSMVRNNKVFSKWTDQNGNFISDNALDFKINLDTSKTIIANYEKPAQPVNAEQWVWDSYPIFTLSTGQEKIYRISLAEGKTYMKIDVYGLPNAAYSSEQATLTLEAPNGTLYPPAVYMLGWDVGGLIKLKNPTAGNYILRIKACAESYIKMKIDVE